MNNFFTKDITIGKKGNVGMRHLNDPVTHVISKSMCKIDRVQKNTGFMLSRLERLLNKHPSLAYYYRKSFVSLWVAHSGQTFHIYIFEYFKYSEYFKVILDEINKLLEFR